VAILGQDHRNFDDGEELRLPFPQARKRFGQFLRTETRSLGSDEPYSGQLMRQKGVNRVLDVDLQDVKNYDDVLGQLLEEQPNSYLPLVRVSRERLRSAHLQAEIIISCYCSLKRPPLEWCKICME
jgi:hypothetical protein